MKQRQEVQERVAEGREVQEIKSLKLEVHRLRQQLERVAEGREVPIRLRQQLDRVAEGREVQPITLRVQKDVHDALRAISFATNTSVNEIAQRAILDYMQQTGHREAVDAFFKRAQEQYRVAFDKLADL